MSNSKVYKAVTERVLDELRNGVVPWSKPWNVRGSENLPKNLISKKAYRGVNLLLLPNTYKRPYFLTFKQCKDLGGHVMKGEKGYMIVFWKILKKNVKDQETGETKTETIPLLKKYYVFNVDQCEGIDEKKIPEVKKAEDLENDLEPVDICEKIYKEMPEKPEVRENGAQAYYSPLDDYIGMPSMKLFKNIEGYYGTLFHEMTHATAHETRLNRETGSRLQIAKYSKEELVAEMGAAFLCSYAGIENDIKQNASYIDHWMKQISEDEKLVVSAAGKAQKAADYILNINHENNR